MKEYKDFQIIEFCSGGVILFNYEIHYIFILGKTTCIKIETY